MILLRKEFIIDVSVLIIDICRLPQAVGPCRASLPRWHFDQSVGRCVQFMFGGCHGNKNKFMTLEECQQTCNGETEVATTTPVYEGALNEAINEIFIP